jgi:hypothetical protein
MMMMMMMIITIKARRGRINVTKVRLFFLMGTMPLQTIFPETKHNVGVTQSRASRT